MFTVFKKLNPAVRFAIVGVITLLSFLAVRNYILTNVAKTPEYKTFSAIITDVQMKDCPVKLYSGEQPIDCHTVYFKDPTNNSNQELYISVDNYQISEDISLERGEIIRINKVESEGEIVYVFTGFDRTLVYFIMLAVFVGIVVLVAGRRGLRSIFSLILSILIIGKVIIPGIIAGYDPILIASAVGFLMLSVQLYITNGVNKETTIAVLGSLFGVLCAVFFAKLFSDMANITGFGDENSGFISLNSTNDISVKDLVIGSFILGVLGVVDDATVSQVAVVAQLKKNNPKIKKPDLFKSAMEVGSSHIGSLMNTLFLAYVASALPLITLLFIYNPTLREIINIDLFTEEIIRTVVGSLGLVLSIPASTYLAVSMLSTKDVEHIQEYHSHTH